MGKAVPAVFLVLIPQAWTQSYPATEGYLGYSHYNNEYGTDRHNSPGVEFNFGYNLARSLQLLADVGVQFHNTDIIWTNGKKAEAGTSERARAQNSFLRSRKNSRREVTACNRSDWCRGHCRCSRNIGRYRGTEGRPMSAWALFINVIREDFLSKERRRA
jgi:hypothetical protein